MSPFLMAGIAGIVLALVAYTVGVGGIERRRSISGRILGWLTGGLVLDVVATGCMLAVASGEVTNHGVVGFIALGLMLLLVAFAWRHRSRFGDDPVAGWLHQYARVAYVLWVLAFVMGVMLGASRG